MSFSFAKKRPMELSINPKKSTDPTIIHTMKFLEAWSFIIPSTKDGKNAKSTLPETKPAKAPWK